MKKRLILIFILIAYCALLVKIMVFKDIPLIRIGPMMFRFEGTHSGPANLVPFKTILSYLFGEKWFIIAFINLAGNIVLLVPVGFLVPFIFNNITWKKSLALAVAAGFAIEGTQAVLHAGIFDVDDIILNGLGVMVGYWLFMIPAKKVRTMKYKNIIITAVIVIAAVAATAFYGVVGHPKGPLSATLASRAAGNSEPDSTALSKNGQPDGSDSLDNVKTVVIPEGDDPCRGTGGTGQIISVGSNSITIKRRDGSNEIIKLTDKTIIKNSAGPLSKSALKTGDRVTVVVMSKHTATAVLVCNAQSPATIK